MRTKLNLPFLRLALSLFLLNVAATVLAYDFEVDGICYNKSGTNATVTFRTYDYNSYSGDVVIPETVTYNGTTYTVTAIGYHAFQDCTELLGIDIPNSVTSIGEFAFHRCTGLSSIDIDIPNSVISIGNYAFYGCTGLTIMNLPNSVETIGDYVFCYCTGLTTVTIPNSVTSIGKAAFAGCTNLLTLYFNAENCADFQKPVYVSEKYVFSDCPIKTIAIGDQVTNIPKYFAIGNTSLTRLTIGKSVEKIGDYAFSGCTGLTKVIIRDLAGWCNITFGAYGNPLRYSHQFYVDGQLVTNLTIPSTVTSIATQAFSFCTALTKVTIPNSVDTIGPYAFWDCTGLTSISIGNSVKTISDYAFDGCSSLTNVVIPNSVDSIGRLVFSGCSGLLRVTIPPSVKSIGYRAFEGCYNLSRVNISNLDNWCAISFYSYGSASAYSNPLYFAKHLYLNGTLVKALSIEHDINDYAFINCADLTSLTISNDAVKTIGSGAFYGCSKLAEVDFGNTVETIGNAAFDGCTALTTITIPDCVRTIGDNAFGGCTSLKTVTIGDKNKHYDNPSTTIGSSAFVNCGELTSVTIGNNVTVIGNDAFHNGSMVTELHIGQSVTEIGASAFEGLLRLKGNIIIPNSVKAIGSYAFASNYAESITIGNKVETIGAHAFYAGNATKLNKVIIHDIGAWCNISFADEAANPLKYAHHLYLDNGDEITNLIIPEPTDSIKGYAFTGCTGLTEVVIPKSVENVENYAFKDCTGLTDVTCEGSVPPMSYKYSFDDATYSKAVLHIPASAVDAYDNEGCWFLFDHINTFVDANTPGDVDGDGKVRIDDVTSIIDLLLAGGEMPVGADVDGDGKVTIDDVTLLIDMLLGGSN